MLDLSDALFVSVPFLSFVPSVGVGELGGLVRGHVRIEDPYIKKCALETTTPESVCGNVQSCSVISVCHAGAQLFSVQRL